MAQTDQRSCNIRPFLYFAWSPVTCENHDNFKHHDEICIIFPWVIFQTGKRYLGKSVLETEVTCFDVKKPASLKLYILTSALNRTHQFLKRKYSLLWELKWTSIWLEQKPHTWFLCIWHEIQKPLIQSSACFTGFQIALRAAPKLKVIMKIKLGTSQTKVWFKSWKETCGDWSTMVHQNRIHGLLPH